MIYIFTSQETEEKKPCTDFKRCSLVAKLLFRKKRLLKSQTHSFHSLHSKQMHQAFAQKKMNNQPAIHYSLMMLFQRVGSLKANTVMERCIYLEVIRIFFSSILPFSHLSSVCSRATQSSCLIMENSKPLQ